MGWLGIGGVLGWGPERSDGVREVQVGERGRDGLEVWGKRECS